MEYSKEFYDLLFPENIKKPLIRNNFIILCGPPASGKTTYAQKNMDKNDILIDLDIIKSEISGKPIYRCPDSLLSIALQKRNDLLNSLYDSKNKVWFIVSGSSCNERDFWKSKLNTELLYIFEIDKIICIKRIINDKRRNDLKNKYISAISEWYRNYKKTKKEKIIKND